MGIEQAKAVSALHARLPGGPFKVLMRMALVSLDRPNDKGQPPGLYFAGWEQLAQALGHDVPDDDGTTLTRKRRKKLKSYVTAAVGVLVDHGVIEREGARARFRTQSTYRLTLGGTQKTGSTRTPEVGVLDDPGSGVHVDPVEQAPRTLEIGVPRKDVGRTEDLPEDVTTPSPALPYDRERAAAAMDESDIRVNANPISTDAKAANQ